MNSPNCAWSILPCRDAKEKYVRLRKERDYHRMHHRKVLQEKDKLMSDIKRYAAVYCVSLNSSLGLKIISLYMSLS